EPSKRLFCPTHGEATPSLLQGLLLQIEAGLDHVIRPAQITPVVIVRPERQDFFSSGGQPQIGSHDREDAILLHQFEQARRNNVDAGKSNASAGFEDPTSSSSCCWPVRRPQS